MADKQLHSDLIDPTKEYSKRTPEIQPEMFESEWEETPNNVLQSTTKQDPSS